MQKLKDALVLALEEARGKYTFEYDIEDTGASVSLGADATLVVDCDEERGKYQSGIYIYDESCNHWGYSDLNYPEFDNALDAAEFLAAAE
jgi:hypothetical protein